MSNVDPNTTTSNTSSATVESNVRPEYDVEIQKIADYVLNYSIDNDSANSEDAWNTARLCLMDTLGCGLLALRFPECTKHLGPDCADQLTPNGARVPGTSHRLDPSKLPSILAVSCAGLIIMTRGWLLNGDILRTI